MNGRLYSLQIKTGLYWSTWSSYETREEAMKRLGEVQSPAEDPASWRVVSP